MDKLDQQMIKLWKKTRSFCNTHRTVSVLIGLLILVIVLPGVFGFDRGFRSDFMRDARGMMRGGDRGEFSCKMGKGALQYPESSCPMGGDRLFDKFCDGSGAMKDAPGFKGKFMKGADKRFDKIPPMKEHLQIVIDELKKKDYDTINLESKLKEIDYLVAQFQSGQQNIKSDPQSFCANHTGRVEINTQIKAIMTGILEEIQKAEGK